MTTKGALLDRALDTQTRGTVTAKDGDGRAEADVVDVDRIGVRVRRVAVSAPRGDVEALAKALPERLRSLPERVEPIEVSPKLGGAVLRTPVDQVREREFFEVEVRGDDVTVERWRATDAGRERVDFDLTRKQLGRLVDELG
jgi:hypothetical protein